MQWGDVIRVIRNLSAPISFFIMFIYWIKHDSSFARKAKEDKAKVLELLQEKDSLIYELSKANSLASAGALAGGLAHELNQYLARIQINTDDAMNHVESNPAYELFKSPLKRILDSNRDAAGMISALRATFTLREDNHLQMEIAMAVKDITNLYRGRILQSKIELKLEIPNQIGVISWGAQLSIVLSNLLLNAIEALDASDNSKKIIFISYAATEKFIFIKVFDNGDPIHPSKVSSIFTMFSTTKKEGVGVGLWLSKFIMEKNQSDLSFENTQEGGVAFIIKIPKDELVKQSSIVIR
jgi:C4-dicarboxylate-specific signal transduction histidine kinase